MFFSTCAEGLTVSHINPSLSVLAITSATLRDAGNYTCAVSNAVATTVAAAMLTVAGEVK